MTNLKQKLKRIGKVGAVSLVGLLPLTNGCSNSSNDSNMMFDETSGYDVYIENNRSINLKEVAIGQLHSSQGKFSDLKYVKAIGEYNGRLDKIDLVNIPKGHPLETYANLDSLETIYQRALKQTKRE